ncbi:hypothetical protein ACQP2T_03990 [Nonomuraea sp. CA-143628]|uniref:hypothetical protein n=1 Tax=Nonomuraea sp. CA-143628 TaxID=3239997 RepID=UPI003D8FA608
MPGKSHDQASHRSQPTPKNPYFLRFADALEVAAAGGESTAERLAHHLWAAGPLADPARTATALVRAGRSAAAKSALEAAERHLRSTVPGGAGRKK